MSSRLLSTAIILAGAAVECPALYDVPWIAVTRLHQKAWSAGRALSWAKCHFAVELVFRPVWRQLPLGWEGSGTCSAAPGCAACRPIADSGVPCRP